MKDRLMVLGELAGYSKIAYWATILPVCLKLPVTTE